MSTRHALATRNFSLDELRTYHRNPRRGNIAAIARSLEINGQYRPIVVNIGTHTGRPLEILAGNHTYLAARDLDWNTITGSTVDVDDLAAARIVAADNRTSDLGDYDEAALAELLQSLDGLDGTGYTDDDLERLLGAPSPGAEENAPIEELPRVFGVIIECDTEGEQAALLEQFIAEGLNVRALM